VEHLFSVWPEMAERVRGAGQVLLLTDFDGTLSPIAGRPEEAVLPDDTRQALEVLASNPRVGVAVVSGRSLGDIKRKVGLQGITYAGNHGIEVEGPCLRFVYPPARALKPVVRGLYSALDRALSGIEGVLVEDKGITLSVHYRLVAEDRVAEVKRICEETVGRLRSEGRIRTTEGKKVYEIRPGVVWDKEDAIVLLLSCWTSSAEAAAGVTFFLGDDLTDEGGFRVMNARGGVSVFVGEPDHDTAARFFLSSPEEVREFLHRLAARL
jgi:trehalose 6-phosphate phosphatase